ncbi:MAG TPA: hypothetical protein VFG29_00880 [Syntrophales bacterium]|nr:hypothetical protein [Syntrophales bacterium]
MSCADLALVPAGGRRRIRSWLSYSRRYVQLDAPAGYCITRGIPTRSETRFLSHASTAAVSSSSPLRTEPASSSSIPDVFAVVIPYFTLMP